jgi:Ni/Co efflux regulator RcnB
MKKLTSMVVVLTLLGSSAAFAQYNGNQNQNYGNRGATTAEQRNNQDQNRNNQSRDQNGYQTGGAQDQGRNDYQQGRNDVRDNPHWSRGDRLPTQYRNNQYVVNDWKNNHLRKPPRGYHWVQADNRYVLAAMATGVIADIIMASNQNNQRSR